MILPKLDVPKVALGLLKAGVFKMLKNSERNCRPARSNRLKVLNSEKSTL